MLYALGHKKPKKLEDAAGDGAEEDEDLDVEDEGFLE